MLEKTQSCTNNESNPYRPLPKRKIIPSRNSSELKVDFFNDEMEE